MKKVKERYHYLESGLPNVWLENGFVVRKTSHGNATAISDVEGLHRLIGTQLSLHKPSLSGAEVRFLRKELDLSQKHLARVVGVSENSVRAWENHRTRITKAPERLLRLLYLETTHRDGEVRALLEALSDANQTAYNNVLELRDTEDGWVEAEAA